MNSRFWQKDVYRYSFISCGLFVLLTIIAMFTYPGGTYTDDRTIGYNFIRNFFSDLGRLTVPNGQPNTLSMILFFFALTTTGVSLIFFFIVIACTPYGLFFDLYCQSVFWAFRTFFVAVSLYANLIFRQNMYPCCYGWIFAASAIFLAAYIALLQFRPSAKTTEGLLIQATGQKIIVYVSILSAMAESGLVYQYQSAL